MTGTVESTEAVEASGSAEMSDPTEPIPQAPPARRPANVIASFGGGWRGAGWLACGVLGGLFIVWFITLGPGEIGDKSDWFFGAAVLVVAMVAMWQNITLQAQTKEAAADAAGRLRAEIAAAEERSAREMVLKETIHRAEMDTQQKLHRIEVQSQRELHQAEVQSQRELARVERIYLLKFLQRQAMIEVSRAVSVHTQMLATLWNQSAAILRDEDRDSREHAMKPIFEQISQAVNDFSVELDNAYLLIEDVRLHNALDRVNEAALMAIRVAEDIHEAVVDGREPESNPVPPVQRLMIGAAAEARRLAWDLLRTALDDSKARTQ